MLSSDDRSSVSDHYWVYTSIGMSSTSVYQKNHQNPLNKIANVSRRVVHQTSLSLLSSISVKNSSAYRIFDAADTSAAETGQNSIDRFKEENRLSGVKNRNKTLFWSYPSKCCEALYDLYSSDSLQKAATALYAKILIILGLAFPLSEVISPTITAEYFQLFYVFLFTGSLSYLLFVYIDILQER